MEQNNEMTANESLAIITETLNNNRKEIVRNSGKFFMMWGILLAVFSLLVYFLWKTTGKAAWNNLWFGLPLIGFALSYLIKSREATVRAENFISRVNGGIWSAFGVFACSVALFCLLFGLLGKDNALAVIIVSVSLTPLIVLIFGLAETISGVVLKNWVIKIAGWITGIGGVAIYFITGAEKEQMLIFTFAGIVLAVTGLIVKYQYK
ncbi:MAG: hypothetical protein IKW99_07845 [Bacteroidales bacterium]|nr:hypothetical protein [Bacteroidales bacterium]